MAIYQYPLKIDSELIEKLKIIANNNSRSLNKEIEFIIKKYIEEQEKITPIPKKCSLHFFFSSCFHSKINYHKLGA